MIAAPTRAVVISRASVRVQAKARALAVRATPKEDLDRKIADAINQAQEVCSTDDKVGPHAWGCSFPEPAASPALPLPPAGRASVLCIFLCRGPPRLPTAPDPAVPPERLRQRVGHGRGAFGQEGAREGQGGAERSPGEVLCHGARRGRVPRPRQLSPAPHRIYRSSTR